MYLKEFRLAIIKGNKKNYKNYVSTYHNFFPFTTQILFFKDVAIIKSCYGNLNRSCTLNIYHESIR